MKVLLFVFSRCTALKLRQMFIHNVSLDCKFTIEILLKFKTSFFQCRSAYNFFFLFNKDKRCNMLVTVLESGQSQD